MKINECVRLLGGLGLLLTSVAVNGAGIIMVDSTADDQPGGACTLRQAIALANGSGNTGSCEAVGDTSPTEIHFLVDLPATITLNHELDALTPTTTMRIIGPGMSELTISGANQTRVFEGTNAAMLHLSHLQITGGRAQEGFGGGGVYFCCGHGLELDHVHVYANHSPFAGGGIQVGDTMIVRDSIFEANTAVQHTPGASSNFGGGVWLVGFGGTALFERVQFIDNIAGSLDPDGMTGLGGALATANSRAPTIIDSTFSGNQALAAEQRTGSNPIPAGLGGMGGAIYAFAELTLINSSVLDNLASFEGGGIFNVGTTHIINSTIAHNSVPLVSEPSRGGGIANAASNGFGNPVVLHLNNTTLYGNSAASGGGLVNLRDNPEQVILYNSVFGHTGTGQAGGDVVNQGGGQLTGYHNLIEHPSASGGLTDGADGNQVGTAAGFGALGDFGGPTQTVSLLPASPLIDAGDAADCPDTDQRGIARPLGDGCDIGAVEWIQATLNVIVSGTGMVDAAALPAPTSGGIIDCDAAGSGMAYCSAVYAEGANENIVLTLAAGENWEIDTVSGCDGQLDGSVYTIAWLGATCVVNAAFTTNHTLEYVAGPNGTIDGATLQTVSHGADGTAVTAIPDPGFRFLQWSDGHGSATRTDSNVTADLTVSAEFILNIDDVFDDRFEDFNP